MEPMRISESSRHRRDLTDLAIELAAHSTGFRRSLPEGVLVALADLVRAMNCYYSNLIEGHDTHPIDIERAMKNDYSANADQRNLQLEAKAHIAVQRWIDEGGLRGGAVSPDGICEIHERFGELLPPELLSVENPDTGERMEVVPGALRQRDVKVGRHIPVSPGALATVSGTVRAYLQQTWQSGNNYRNGSSPSPACCGYTLSYGWQRSCCTADVSCDAAGGA